MKAIYSLVSLLILSSSVAQADTSLNYLSDGEASVIKISNGKARMEVQGQSGALIFDSQSGKLLALDSERQQYIDMQEVMDQVGGMQDQLSNIMSDAMQGSSAEEKAMMKNMMGGLMGGLFGEKPKEVAKPAKASISRTGKMETINGFKCEQIVFSDPSTDNEKENVICVAKPAELDMSSEDYAVMQKMFTQLKKMGDKAKRFTNGSSLAKVSTVPDGVPVKTYVDPDSELTAVDHQKIAAAQFEIPAAYSPVKLPSF